VAEDLRKEAEREADARVRAELVEQIIAANAVTAPRPLVERALYVYAQAYGVPEERWPQFAEEFRPVAEGQVRRDLVLDHVMDAQQLRATEAELDQRIRSSPSGAGCRRPSSMPRWRRPSGSATSSGAFTEEKVFAFLLSQSTVEQA